MMKQDKKNQLPQTDWQKVRSTSSLIDAPSRPVFFVSENTPPNTKVEPHSHQWNQFLCIQDGTMQIEVGGMIRLVPPNHGIWLPNGTEHTVWAVDGIRYECINIDRDFFNDDQQIACKIVKITPLVQLYVSHIRSEVMDDYDLEGKDAHKISVLVHLLEELPEASLYLPLPQDPKLLEMCRNIQRDPGLPHLPEVWADKLNMSLRTFGRRFKGETHLTFNVWRQRLRLLNSIAQLEQGESVTKVALDAGYSSSSSYIYAFNQVFGASPLKSVSREFETG